MSQPAQPNPTPRAQKSTPEVSKRRERFVRYLKFALPLAAVSLEVQPTDAHAYMGEQLLNQATNYFIAPLFVLSIVFAGVGALFNSNYARVAVYSAIICAGVFTFIKAAPTLMTAVQA